MNTELGKIENSKAERDREGKKTEISQIADFSVKKNLDSREKSNDLREKNSLPIFSAKESLKRPHSVQILKTILCVPSLLTLVIFPELVFPTWFIAA